MCCGGFSIDCIALERHIAAHHSPCQSTRRRNFWTDDQHRRDHRQQEMSQGDKYDESRRTIQRDRYPSHRRHAIFKGRVYVGICAQPVRSGTNAWEKYQEQKE